MTTASPVRLRTTTSNPARGGRPSNLVSTAASLSLDDSALGTVSMAPSLRCALRRPSAASALAECTETPSGNGRGRRRRRHAGNDVVDLLARVHAMEVLARHPLLHRAALQADGLGLELVVLLAQDVDLV